MCQLKYIAQRLLDIENKAQMRSEMCVYFKN